MSSCHRFLIGSRTVYDANLPFLLTIRFDTLSGDGGQDWFVSRSGDVLTDRASNETVGD